MNGYRVFFPRFACALAMVLATSALEAHAELVRCTSKDGKSSVIRKDRCDSPDDVRTPVKADAATSDAMAAYKAGDYARARQLFEPRARNGDALAQIMMGDMYRNGHGVP